MNRLRGLALILFGAGLLLLIWQAIRAGIPAQPATSGQAAPVTQPAMLATPTMPTQLAAPSPPQTATTPSPALSPGSPPLPSPAASVATEALETSLPPAAPVTPEQPATAHAATVAPTAPVPPSATTPPPSAVASATPAAKIVNNAVEPPWWPCAPGEVKGLAKLQRYYPPGHPVYPRVYVSVTCFPGIEAAQAAGLSEAPQ